MNTFNIGNIVSEPSTKKFGYLLVDKATTPRTFQYNTVMGPPRQRAVMIPLMVINGSKDGPTLCINAGVHATEYCGVGAIIQLFKEINPEEINGKLLLIPVVNPASFWTMTPYVNIQDGVDISSVYGSKGTTVSYLIAEKIMNEVFTRSDLVIDFHAGDLLEELLPHCGFTRVGDKELDDRTEDLAKGFCLDYIHISETNVRQGRYVLDIPQFYVEIGCCGKLRDSDVELALKGVYNVMKKMGMIEGQPTINKKIKLLRTGDYIYSNSTGLYISKSEVGDAIKKDQVLGEICGLDGEILETVIAPSDGVIFLKMFNPVKLPGDLIYKCIK